MLPKFDWKIALKIFAALVIGGFVWTQDNQVAALTLAAMGIVWGIKTYSQSTGQVLGKAWLTGILLTISVGFALLFQPVTVQGFPIYDGDVFAWINAVFGWLSALLALGGEVFALATGLYNILLAKVLDGLSTAMLKPAPTLVKPRRK